MARTRFNLKDFRGIQDFMLSTNLSDCVSMANKNLFNFQETLKYPTLGYNNFNGEWRAYQLKLAFLKAAKKRALDHEK